MIQPPRFVVGCCAVLTFIAIIAACAVVMPFGVRTYYAWSVPSEEIADAGYAWELMTWFPVLAPVAMILALTGAIVVYLDLDRWVK